MIYESSSKTSIEASISLTTMSHNRSITIGDSWQPEPEPKFVAYPSGKIVLNFGKYKAKRLEDIPEGYLRWMLNTMDLEQNISKAVHNALRKAS